MIQTIGQLIGYANSLIFRSVSQLSQLLLVCIFWVTVLLLVSIDALIQLRLQRMIIFISDKSDIN